MAWYGIGFTDAVKRALRKYATFSGRASRGEFWWFQLAVILAAIAYFLISTLLSGGALLSNLSGDSILTSGAFIFFSLFSLLFILLLLVLIIPSCALAVRRLHDIGKSGWTLFGAFIFILVLGLVRIIVPLIYIGSSNYIDGDILSNTLGLYFILALIAAIPSFYMAFLYANASEPTSNEYGPGPQEVTQHINDEKVQQYIRTLPSNTHDDPILTELMNPTTPPSRLHKIATLSIEKAEYRTPLLAHPNIYSELKQWIRFSEWNENIHAPRPQYTHENRIATPTSHLQEIATLNNLNRLISTEKKVVNELDEEINAKMQELGDINITNNTLQGNMDTRYMEHLHNKQTQLAVEIEELQNEKELRQENLEELKEKRAHTSSATPPRNTTQPPSTPPPPPSIPQPPPPPPDPVLTELADPTTSATRLQEIAALTTEHPEYRAPLLEHPNIYPKLKEWINQLD